MKRPRPATDDGLTDADVGGVRLRLQRLPAPLQVLAVGALASLRHEGQTFATRDVAALFTSLRLPSPSKNLSSMLSRLAIQGLLMRPTSSSWTLTPEGEHRLLVEAGHVPSALLAGELDEFAGTEFGRQRHTLIPPFLAPSGTEIGLQRLLGASSFDTNVMLIARFPTDSDDPFTALIARLRTATAGHGLTLLLASDGNAEDTLWSNVVTYMWGSRYGIVLMDSADRVLNYNVLIEIGGMLMTGRRCAILRDVKVPKMPTDLVGHIYKPVELADHDGTEAVVHRWITDDLGLPACARCPTGWERDASQST